MKDPNDNKTQDWLEVTMPIEVAQAALAAMKKHLWIGSGGMTGFTELRDQINKTTDLQEKELLLEQLEALHRAADEESKLHEDLIRGEWRVWNE